MTDKEVRFSEKKVDESWKENVSRIKGAEVKSPVTNNPQPQNTEPKSVPTEEPLFTSLISSLGMQALMNLGEIHEPGVAGPGEINLDAAKEMIDILVAVKKKTKGNLTKDEDRMLTGLISDLQLKFVQHQS